MNTTLANLSTDLRRISYWIYNGNDKLAAKFLDDIKTRYKIKKKIGVYNNIWLEIKKVRDYEGGKIMAADRAATLSSVILMESYKI